MTGAHRCECEICGGAKTPYENRTGKWVPWQGLCLPCHVDYASGHYAFDAYGDWARSEPTIPEGDCSLGFRRP